MKRFGPYELEELLGRGGMGEVHRAVDTRKGRKVALKLLPAALTGEPEVESRFRREAEVAARLTDPHVIPIHDYGELHGRLFLDMRLVEGVDLSQVIRAEGALPPPRAVSLLAQVAGALDSAHESGLVHRDVKPSNILLTTPRRRAEDFVYLIDFGIAAGATVGTRLTATGQTIGTAAYMAPERFTEDRESDPRVDVYSLGCVLYEMLTGQVPFDGTSFPNLMYQHLHQPVPAPSRTVGLPAFDEVIARALAKDPSARFARAGELADAAQGALGASSGADRWSAGPGAPPGATRVPGVQPRTRVAPGGGLPSAPSFTGLPPGSAGPPAGPRQQEGATSRTWLGPTLAVAVAVLAGLWVLISAVGTGMTFSSCGVAVSACVGGAVGVVATGVGVVSVVLAIAYLVRRRRGPRALLGLAWAAFGASIFLLFVTAGFDALATS